MVLRVVCSDDRNTAPWHIEILSDHQSKNLLSKPELSRDHKQSSKKEKRRNIATTGKHNTQTRREQGEGRMVVLGLFLMEKSSKTVEKVLEQHKHAFYLCLLPSASVNSLLDWILFVPVRCSWNHDSVVVSFPHTQRFLGVNIEQGYYLQLTTLTFFRADQWGKFTLSTLQTTRWCFRVILENKG